MVADFRQAQAASSGRLGTNGVDPEAQLVCFGLPSRKDHHATDWTVDSDRRAEDTNKRDGQGFVPETLPINRTEMLVRWVTR